jgi:hypothetical protein
MHLKSLLRKAATERDPRLVKCVLKSSGTHGLNDQFHRSWLQRQVCLLLAFDGHLYALSRCLLSGIAKQHYLGCGVRNLVSWPSGPWNRRPQ